MCYYQNFKNGKKNWYLFINTNLFYIPKIKIKIYNKSLKFEKNLLNNKVWQNNRYMKKINSEILGHIFCPILNFLLSQQRNLQV